MPARKWTLEQRARQAELIPRWEPGQQSTGARTPKSKAGIVTECTEIFDS